jgi:hypothetical protein
MWIALSVLIGVVLAWVAVDHWQSWRSARARKGPTAWSDFGRPGALFHSTGFEDTLPPALAARAERRQAPIGSLARH